MFRALLLTAAALPALPQTPVHVRGNHEITYTQVDVWADLRGPGFHKRVCGFGDGGAIFRVRLVATAPGDWSWTSGPAPHDGGS